VTAPEGGGAREGARDELVAKALAELPVPGHRPTFWADLERAVAAEVPAAEVIDAGAGAAGAGAAGEGEPADAVHAAADAGGRRAGAHRRLDTGEIPSVRSLAHERSPRSTRAPWLAAAAALLVLASAVGITLLGGDGDGGSELADAPTVTTASDASTLGGAPAAEPTHGSEAPVAVIGQDPLSAVEEFIGALGSGDSEGAAAILGARSLRYIESIGATATGVMQESQEGFGAWGGSPDITLTATDLGVVDLLGAGTQAAFVTVAGTYPGEGESQFRIDVLPVVREGDSWRVEHLAHDSSRANELVFTVPRSQNDGSLGGMNPSDDVNVFVPANGTVFFQIDGGEVQSDATSMVGRDPMPFSLFNPPQDLPPGTHQLVVVAIGEDDTITYFAGTFLVEG